jgi:hypothetical protein
MGYLLSSTPNEVSVLVARDLTCRDAKEIIAAALRQLPELAQHWGQYKEGFLELDEDMSLNLK